MPASGRARCHHSMGSWRKVGHRVRPRGRGPCRGPWERLGDRLGLGVGPPRGEAQDGRLVQGDKVVQGGRLGQGGRKLGEGGDGGGLGCCGL